MDKAIITFEPDGKSIEVDVGTSVLDATIIAGIPINSICGGEGTCSKCKILIKSDPKNFKFNDTEILTHEDKNKGYYLACQTIVIGNLIVEVPEITRILDKDSQILKKTECVELEQFKPWCKNINLNLAPPSTDNNLSDWQRLYFVLKKSDSDTQITIPLELLRKLPQIIRDADWKLTCTLIDLGDKKEIIKIDKKSNKNRIYGFAIDIGTTTIVVELVDLLDGHLIDTASEYNRQILRGEDILSRVIHCEENKKGLGARPRNSLKSHILIIKTSKGLVVIAGCSHPGLENILEVARNLGKVYAVLGGFHGFNKFDVLKGISLILLCHCTQYKQEILNLYPKTSYSCGAGKIIVI